MYRTRLIVKSVHTRPPVIRTGSDSTTSATSALVYRFFGWTQPVFSTTADSFVSTAGLDAYMFGRVMQFGIEVFAMATLVGLGVVLPVNLQGKVVQDDDVNKHGNANAFTRLTMGNIMNGSDLFFVHFFVVYVVVLWTIHCLRRMFCEYVLLRRAFLSKSTDQYSKANSVSVSPREEDKYDPDVERDAHNDDDDDDDDDTASIRAADTSKAAPGGVSARLDKDLADFDGLFYDDISFVDPVTGTESFINNVHRYVVLLQNVPRRKARAFGDSTIGDDIAAYFSRKVSRLTTRLVPGLARAFSYPQRRHHYNYHSMNGIATSTLGADTPSWPRWLESLRAPSTLDNGMGGFAEEVEEEDDDIGADIDHIMEKVTAIFPRSEVAHVVPVLDGRRVDELMMQKYRLKQRLKRLRSHIAVSSSSSSSSKRDDNDEVGDDDLSGATASRQSKAKGLSCCVGDRRERQRVLADSLRASIARLRREIEKERSVALQNTPTSSSATLLSYFIIFRSQQTAMMARQMLLFESDVLGQEYSIEKAPAPTDIIWDSIVNSGYPEMRALRVFVSNLLVAALVILPVGAVSGGISTVSVLLCTHYDHRAADDASEALGSWLTSVAKLWCVATPDSLRSFVTGIIPSLIIAYYGGVILPTAFYVLALSESVAISKAQVDRRIAEWYWYWSTINVFFSSLAGGSVLSQINIALAHPESIPRLLGTAIPKFSNFFINYIAFQGFVGNTILLLLPSTWNVLFSHQLWRSVARVLCCCWFPRRRPRPQVHRTRGLPSTRNDSRSKSGREDNISAAGQEDKEQEEDDSSQTSLLSGSNDDDDGVAFATDVTQLRPQSLRYGREAGLTMLVFLIGMVYCIQSPIIAPVALMYFCGMWLVLRFHMLYVYVRSYESCGEMMFKYVAKAVFNSLKIMVALMALLFLVYARWALGVLLLMTLMPVVHIAGVDTDMRIMQLDEGVPLETVIRSESFVAPHHHHHGGQKSTTGSSLDDSDRPSIPSELYMPSSLRRNGRGWAANGNMVWVNWNVPRHGL